MRHDTIEYPVPARFSEGFFPCLTTSTSARTSSVFRRQPRFRLTGRTRPFVPFFRSFIRTRTYIVPAIQNSASQPVSERRMLSLVMKVVILAYSQCPFLHTRVNPLVSRLPQTRRQKGRYAEKSP